MQLLDRLKTCRGEGMSVVSQTVVVRRLMMVDLALEGFEETRRNQTCCLLWVEVLRSGLRALVESSHLLGMRSGRLMRARLEILLADLLLSRSLLLGLAVILGLRLPLPDMFSDPGHRSDLLEYVRMGPEGPANGFDRLGRPRQKLDECHWTERRRRC